MLFYPIASLIFIAAISRHITKSWLSPGCFFSSCWAFFIIVPVVFAPEYTIDQIALWFIAIFSMSIASGSIIAYSKDVKSMVNNTFQIDYNFLFYFMSGFILISLFGLVQLFNYATTIYVSGKYLNDWMMIPNMIAVDRYSGILNYPSIIKYSLYFIYPANLLGGLLFLHNNKSKTIKFLSLLPLILAILLGIMEGARTSFLLALIMFFSAWLSTFIFKRRKKLGLKKLYFRIIIGTGFTIVLFTSFFVLVQWLRQGMDTIIVDSLIDRIRAYFFGYLAAFSQWLNMMPESSIFNTGFITFAGPFNLIGIMERPLGFYNPTYISNDVSTNVFTAFRGIVTDFSIPGAIIIAFVIGFIFQIIFQKGKTILSTIPISMFYAFTLYSPLISIFHYNSILFSWLILLIILMISRYEPLDNFS